MEIIAITGTILCVVSFIAYYFIEREEKRLELEEKSKATV